MEQLNSMFTRLKRGLYAGGDTSHPPEKQRSFNSNPNVDNASEDEGFVLISQNECSETTERMSTSEKMPAQNSAPYMVNGQDPDRAGRDFTMFATCSQLSTDSESAADVHDNVHGITIHPAVLGVPFEINPKLLQKERLLNMFNQLSLHNAQFDWQKYQYDFSFEQSCLKELHALEEKTMLADRGTLRSIL